MQRAKRPRAAHFPARGFAFTGLQGDFPPRRRGGFARRRTPAHRGVAYPIAVAPSFSKDLQTFPRKFQGNSKLFQTFPRICKLFPWPFRGKSRGYRSVEPESRFSIFLRRLGRDERPGGALPNALGIQFSVNFDHRKGNVGGDFPWGPRAKRGAACANAKADRRDAGAVRLRRRAPSFPGGSVSFRSREAQGAKPACGGALNRASKKTPVSRRAMSAPLTVSASELLASTRLASMRKDGAAGRPYLRRTSGLV